MKRIVGIVFALISFSQSLYAHHGLDYMLLQDGRAPEWLSFMPFTAADFSRGAYGDEFNIESGLLLGLGRDFGLGVSAGWSDEEGGDWRYSAVTPYLSMPLFRSDSIPWLKISLFAGWQFAADPEEAYREVIVYETRSTSSSRQVSSTVAPGTQPVAKSHSHSSAGHSSLSKHSGGGGGGGGPDAPGGGGGAHDHPVAAPAVPTTIRQPAKPKVVKPVLVVKRIPVDPYAGATGIHRHGEEGLVARLITTVDLDESNQVAFNLINFTPRSGRTGWGYAAAWRHTFHHDLAFSLEATGDFDSEAWHEVVGAVHWSPLHWMVLKLGAGTGLGEESSDLSIHTGLVLRF